MSCSVLRDDQGVVSTTTTTTTATRDQADKRVVVSLADCVQSINLRSLGTFRGKDVVPVALPLTLDDTVRMVRAITERLELVPAVQMATIELKKHTRANLLIAVTPPPKMHVLFQRTSTNALSPLHQSVGAKGTMTTTRLCSKDDIRFPVTNGRQGASVGRTHFRKKCALHATHFTRCWCVLPLVSTPAHIEALTLALGPSSVVSIDDLHDQDST